MQISRHTFGLLLAAAFLVTVPVSASSKEDGDILTVPRPGDEYVLFKSNPKTRESSEEVEDDLNLGSNSALLGVLTGSILSPADTLPVIEVQTEVSVVTSKEVLVGGRPVAPAVEVAPMSDTGRRQVNNAEEEERKILERKAKAGKKKAPATIFSPVPALVLGASEGVGKAVEVVPEAIKGVQSPKFEPKEGEIGVPPQKAIEGTTQSPAVPLTTVPPLPFRSDIVAVNLLTDQNVGSSSGGLFGPNSGSDKTSLEPAASNQASRVNVKKGPNGEDYEYEYVYYYYDDDEKEKEAKGSTSGSKEAAPIFEDIDDDKDEDNETPVKVVTLPSSTSTSTTTSTTTTTTTTTTTERPTTEAARTRTRGRGSSGNRSRFAVKNQASEEDEESVEEDYSSEVVPDRGFGRQRTRGGGDRESSNAAADGNGRNRVRYTTIDRSRASAEEASVGNRVRGSSIEEAVPASNEVGGSRSGPRYRSRSREQSAATVPAEPIPEERLPSNTRFPPRGRGRVEDASPATEPITRTPAPTPSSSPVRGAVRPSLELVDSSSFRTNAGGASPDQDLAAPSFPAVPSGAPVRFLGVNAEGGEEEEEVDPTSYLEDPGRVDAKRNKARTEAAPTTTPPTPEASADPSYTQDLDEEISSSTLPAAVEKSVLDLYAILQAQDNTSNLVSTEEGDDASSNISTTPQDAEETTTTAQPTTTTLPTTTTIPTTTTTTTTTTPAPTTEKVPGRRFRGRGNAASQATQNGGRNRFRRPDSGTTSTTTEAPSSEAPARGRFNPNRNGGGARGRGSYGRRSTTTAAPASADESDVEEEKPATRTFARPSLSRTPGNRFRGRASTTAPPSATTEGSQQETGGSSSPAILARPTFADRYNLRRRVGLSTTTTAAPAAEEQEEGEAGATSDATESSPAPPSETPGRLPRPRVRPPGSLSPRPLRPGPRINLAGRSRTLSPLPGTASTAAAEEGSDVVQDEAASETHSAADEHEESEDEDKPAVTTPVPGPLTRLRSRPRLRVTEKATTARPAQASSAGRRQLVSSLLPRRRPGQASTAAPAAAEEGSEGSEHLEEGEEHKEEGAEGEEEAAPTTPATSTTAHQEERGLAGLLAGRKRARRPGTLFPGRPLPQSNGDA